jgi:SAM-dependent methyltransferase
VDSAAYFQVAHRKIGARDPIWAEVNAYLHRSLDGGVGGTVVDLGAGYCSFINAATNARRRIAVDVNPECAHYAGEGVEFHAGSADDLDFLEDDSADVVFASNLLEHLSPETGRRLVRGARRALRPGGTLILVQPNFYHAYREYFHDVTHQTAYTHIGLGDLLEGEGFELARMEPRFLPLSMQRKYGGFDVGAVPDGLMRVAVQMYLAMPFRVAGKQMLVVGRKPRRVGP